MKILVLGASGLLGHTVFSALARTGGLAVFGTTRSQSSWPLFPTQLQKRLLIWNNQGGAEGLSELFTATRPDVVINCIATPRSKWSDYRQLISDFSTLPHLLAAHCQSNRARLILISSDGVFSGAATRPYNEADIPDPADDYGTAKLLGEVSLPHVLIVRTSIIGHSLSGSSGLVDWFLSQDGSCLGFPKAIFSGLPTVVLASLIRDVLLPRPALNGLYHIASEPISKLALLDLVARRYGKAIEIRPDDSVAINRSLSAEKFAADTGFRAPPWSELVDAMYLNRSSQMVQNVHG